MLPNPLAVQSPPPAPTQVQLAPVIASGSVSTTVAPFAALGPTFEATIVQVTGSPATAPDWPSVFFIEGSAPAVGRGTAGAIHPRRRSYVPRRVPELEM